MRPRALTPAARTAVRAAMLAATLALGMGGAQGAGAQRPCRLEGLSHEALCGAVERPLDPRRPQGARFELHYAVLPALARHKRADPVFFFAGGPGQSAIDLAGLVAGRFERLLMRRDVVLIDQRGTGRSAPLRCDRDGQAAGPIGEQLDPARQLQALQRCRTALERLPYGDLRMFTTTLAMQDADAVRAALGAERIDAVGASYGTRAVLEYMRQFPGRVRRAVIDGAAPPDMALPASFSTDNQAALDALFAACSAEPACAAAHPDLRARWEALLAGLPRRVAMAHPLTGRVEPLTMTRELLLSTVRLPLYVPVLASGLPQAIADAAEGRFEPLAALGSGLQGPRAQAALAEGMHFSVVCSEDMPRLAQADARPGADFGRSFEKLYRDVCAFWPHGAVPPAFYRMPPAPAATLVLSGSIDPATPPRHGAHVVRALGAKARHVVVPNAGHGVMGVGCMDDVVYRFIDAQTDALALQVDAGCAAQLPRPPAFRPVEPPGPRASGVPLPPAAPRGLP